MSVLLARGLAETIHCPQSYFNVLSLLRITVIQQYTTILSHPCSNSHHRQHFVSDKEASDSTSAQTPTLTSTVRLPRGTSVHSTVHKTGSFLSSCFLLLSVFFFFISQTINCVTGKEMVFHSLPLPFYLFVCLFNVTKKLHLPFTVTLSPNPENTSP